MLEIFRYGASFVLVIAAWRGASELVARWTELAASGALDARLAQRRADTVARALAATGLTSPVLAAVHAGSVGPADVDDMGLLDGAMRRAVPGYGPGPVRARRSAPATATSGATRSRRPARVTGHEFRVAVTPVDCDAATTWSADAGPSRAPTWAVLAGATGLAVTTLPLVRPLEPGSPWVALAGCALACAAWIGARAAR